MNTQELGTYLSGLIEYVISGLLDHPERAEVSFIHSVQALVFDLRAAPEDRGRLIGTQGRNIEALRTLCMSVGARYRIRVHVKLVEEEKGEKVGPIINPL